MLVVERQLEKDCLNAFRKTRCEKFRVRVVAEYNISFVRGGIVHNNLINTAIQTMRPVGHY